MTPLRIGTFTPSVLLDVARRTGRLESAGLDVQEVPVTSSPAQFSALIAGDLDLIVTSPDNVLAYKFLGSNPLNVTVDAVITAGLDRTAGLSLCLRAGLENMRDARLGVDVPGSGFAFAAFGLLDIAGYRRSEYEVVALGSSPRRAQALIAGECDMTILGAGNEFTAEAAGCTIHSSVAALGPYLGEVIARLNSSASAEAADALAGVLVETADAVRAGALQETTRQSAADVLGLPPALAAAHYERLMRDGLLPGGMVPRESFRTLINLRRTYLPSDELDAIEPRLAEILILHAAGLTSAD